MNCGVLKVNLQQMKKWRVYSDNVRFYDAIMRTGGTVLTLDARPYVDLLCEFGIFYTLERK